MMSHLASVYRRVHEQGFLPIFTKCDVRTEKLVEACLEAGCQAIEYTLRRPDAREMIPWIRQRYPELTLLVGSTLDNDEFVQHGRKLHPQLMTLDELAVVGVDGFVSMVGMRRETIERYSSTHLTIAPVATTFEMFNALSAGAHFVKVAGNQLDFVGTLRDDATFDLCPIMVTGGMTLERIELAVKHGASLMGAGFDLILNGHPKSASVGQIAKSLGEYIRVTQGARHEKWPALAAARGRDFCAWTAALPHYHPFAKHHC